MLISDQFKRAFAILAGVILLACILFFITDAQWKRVARARTWGHAVVKAVLECNLLGSEYLGQNNARAKEQYRISSGRLNTLLANPPQALAGAKFVHDIVAQKSRIDDLLLRYEENSAAASEEVREERRSVLNSQMILQSTGMLASAEGLYVTADGKARAVRFWTMILVVSALLGIGLATGLLFWWTHRSLIDPLHQLSESAQRLGSGDLGYRVTMKRRDELGMLAQSFNKMAEQLANRQMNLEEKLKDLDTFCYSLAHDLKAPLRSVAGFGELLESDYAGALGSDGRGYVTAMRGSTLKMAALIDDLLQYGSLTHKEFPIELVPLGSVVTECLRDLERDFSARGANLKVDPEFPTVMGNRVILRQILMNFLTNALKFVPRGQTPEIAIHVTTEAAWCRLMVRDNGIGIPAEHQKKIFGLFQRLHGDSEYPGTGVGLAMVEKGIHLLGGSAGVESEPGRGSTFWIKMPKGASAATERAASESDLRGAVTV